MVNWNSLEMKSFALCLSSVLFGMMSLLSDYWLVGAMWHVGFIKACGPGVCVTYSDILSNLGDWSDTVSAFNPMAGRMMTRFAPLAKRIYTYYALGLLFAIYLPLITIFLATVLKAVSLRSGPSKMRDSIATICAWIATYHAVGIMVCTIVIGIIKNSTMMGMFVSFGWSPYVGMLAVFLGLAGAVTSLPFRKKGEIDTTNPDEPVLLDNMGEIV